MNEEIIKNEEIIRIEDIVDILIKRWKMILSITLIATIVAAIISFFVIAPKYEASTKVFIGKENTKDQNYNNSDIQMYQQLLKTYAGVITTNDLVEKAIDKDDLDLKSEEILESLTVTPSANTQILEIKYTSKDKVLARDLVRCSYNSIYKIIYRAYTKWKCKNNRKCKIPESPVSPNKKMNIAIAFLLGLMISVGLCIFIGIYG